MSASIDERVASIKFDNKQFEAGAQQSLGTLDKLNKGLKLENAGKGFGDIDAAASRFSLGGVGSAVDAISQKFSAFGIMGVTALMNITNKAVDAGIQLAKSLTIDPMKTGMQEYETQINAVQTILANTSSKGTNLDQVNSALAELNTYADKTIYNFTEMTRNIGTFTAAGVDLKTSVADIKGIANLAAVSGSNAQQASSAMYQLSQAVASGTVRLMDWQSVNTAGMGGQVFQDALKDTARKHKINIDQMIKQEGSFRDTLQKGWLTSDVLNETLLKFTVDRTNTQGQAQLKAMGYTDQEIAKIVELGQMATDAATKVKTFSQLQSTLAEAVQSGWTQSWQIIIGDFEEAKTLYTEISDILGKMIGASADSRNNLLQGWKDLGGRTVIIETLRTAFESVMAVLQVIGKAWKEVFPPTTAKELYTLTENLYSFVASLRPSETTLALLGRTFKGVFAVLDIGWHLLKVVGRGFSDFFSKISPGGNSVLELTARLGDWLVKMDQLLYGYDVFNRGLDFFEAKVSRISAIIKMVVNYIGNLGKQIAGADTSGVTSFVDKLRIRFEPLTKLFDGVAAAFGWIGKKMQEAAPIFAALGTLFAKLFGAISEKITGALRNANFDNMGDLFNMATLSLIVAGILKFIKSLTSVTDNTGGMLGNLKAIFAGLKGSLEQLQASLKAKVLMQIALAIAIMTASVIALSLIDSEALTKSLTAMSVMFGQLFGSMGIFEKLTAKTNFENIVKVTTAMILMAIAIDLLTIAVVALSKLSVGELAKGLIAVQTILMELALFMSYSNFSDSAMKDAASIILLGIALKIIASAVADFGSMSVEQLTKGLVTIAAVLAELAIFFRVVSSAGNMGQAGIAMVLISASLMIMANALGTLGNMSWGNIAKALVVLAGSLILIAAAMKVMVDALPGAAALLIASVGLLVLANALTIMGNMSWGGIGKAMVALLGSLVILAAGLTLMVASLPGALALAVVAAALMLFLPVLFALGNMSWGEMGKGLAMLGAIFGALALGGLLIAPVVPILMALGIAITLLGVGMLAAGVGVLAFSTAFAALAVTGAVGAAALVAIVSALAGLIPMIMRQFGLGVIEFANVISTSGPTLIAAFTTLLLSLLTAINTVAPKLIATLVNIIMQLLIAINVLGPAIITVLTNLILALVNAIVILIPSFVDAGMKIIIGILDGIANNIGQVVTSGTNIITNLLQGIGDNASKLVQAGADMVVKIIDAFAQGITDNAQRIRDAAGRLGIAIVDGMTGGLGTKAQELAGKAKELGDKAIEAIRKAIDSHSPSRKGHKLGVYTAEGFSNGIVAATGTAVKSAGEMGSAVMQSLQDSISKISTSEIDANPTIRPVLDLTDVKMGANQINGILAPGAISVGSGYAMASSISTGFGQSNANSTATASETPTVIHYEQNNYSPKALSRLEIYRQTNNQLAMLKGVLSKP